MEQRKILLVDDEEEFVSTLSERLELRGISTATATSGEEALELINADPPQVVIIDVVMPGMSGLDVVKYLKKMHPRVQVILLTGRGSTKEGIEGMLLGAFDYLMKPLQIEELITKIKEAITKWTSEKEEGRR
jgi:DNA-binding NtrC family response regulator